MAKNRDRYVEFWKQFGAMLKEGIHVDFENREKLQELLLFQTSKTDAGAYISLAEYVERMPDSQADIYYITAEDRQAADNSPHLEAFRSHDFEVLYMTDPIDEWVVQSLTAYKEKSLKSIAKGDIDLDTDEGKEDREKARKEAEEKHKDLVAKIKEILGDKVKEVRLSQRLTKSACCLVADEFSLGIQMEKIMKAMNQDVPPTKRILEINPGHPVVEVMQSIFDKQPDSDQIADYTELLYDQALLTAQLPVEDPLRFTRRISDLMAEHGRNVLGAEPQD
jgi:molecular chaperone HtpG